MPSNSADRDRQTGWGSPTRSQARLTPLELNELPPDAKALYDELGEGTRDVNITRTLLRHPDLLRRFTEFGMYFLDDGLLPVRERELVVLRIAWLCGCEYVWGQHVALSRREGIAEAEIERVVEGPDASAWSALDRALIRVADELQADARISDATWQTLAGQYDERRLLELVFTAGQYTLICRVANSCGIPLDAGLPGFPTRS
ncbi:MAG: carboxymuconolactone decarboxylase family protein [Deltaproteobacteria bacterium]|nr:carboxymuconolactone decarboxylase family protein [Deltaproteobacteria bacterium]